jgi:hypothetical protein
MNSILKSDCGRPVLEVEYNPATCNWDEAIAAAYALHGLRPGQAVVIAIPAPTTKSRAEGGHEQKQLAGF